MSTVSANERILSTTRPDGPSPESRAPSEIWCLRLTLLGVVLAGIGFLFFLPPPTPSASAQEVVAYWSHLYQFKRLGAVSISIGGALLIGFAVVLARMLWRIEGPGSPLALIMMGGGVMGCTCGIVWSYFFAAILFRLDRPVEITAAMTDLAWVPLVGVWITAGLQAVAFGVGILGDKRTHPILPRWLGYFSIWYAAVAVVDATLVPFFRSGPFAWNGLLAFYSGLIVFFVWIAVIFVVVRRTLLGFPVERVDS